LRSSFVASEHGYHQEVVVQLHDRVQYITIGISSNDVPSAIGLKPAGLRLLQCTPQIDKGDAPILHRLPRMIINEDSAAAGKGSDPLLRCRRFQ
jgi:hypothetical protein